MCFAPGHVADLKHFVGLFRSGQTLTFDLPSGLHSQSGCPATSSSRTALPGLGRRPVEASSSRENRALRAALALQVRRVRDELHAEESLRSWALKPPHVAWRNSQATNRSNDVSSTDALVKLAQSGDAINLVVASVEGVLVVPLWEFGDRVALGNRQA